jgi:Holliday junction resolvase RusA-like endonuclease
MKMSVLNKRYKELYDNLPDDYDSQIEFIKSHYRINDDDVQRLINIITNIEWQKLKFSFNVIPQPACRPRFTGSGVVYVEGAKENWNYVSKIIQDVPIIHTACKLLVESYYPIPSTMNSSEKILAQMKYIRPVGGGDWDNLGKTYSDAIQRTLIINDNIIISGTSEKYYCLKPRVDITIEYQVDYDSKYNKKRIESTTMYKKLIGDKK